MLPAKSHRSLNNKRARPINFGKIVDRLVDGAKIESKIGRRGDRDTEDKNTEGCIDIRMRGGGLAASAHTLNVFV